MGRIGRLVVLCSLRRLTAVFVYAVLHTWLKTEKPEECEYKRVVGPEAFQMRLTMLSPIESALLLVTKGAIAKQPLNQQYTLLVLTPNSSKERLSNDSESNPFLEILTRRPSCMLETTFGQLLVKVGRRHLEPLVSPGSLALAQRMRSP